jgi:hypothetical protein
MQNSQLPTKWTVPFADGDGAKVELPVTTAAPGRASLNLGFPPLTQQPLEVGGLPPQGEDFNGAMNQVARFVWWQMAGGAIPFDPTWSADSHINGYPQGAKVAAADLQGVWISLIENNTANPDTTGTGWAPGFAYGTYNATGLTGGTTTLTPAQAMKPRITFSGALTADATIILPAWLYNWSFFNMTTGAFLLTVKTAAGAGINVPQNGLPVAAYGDGTNIVSAAPSNVGGRLLRTTVYSRIAGVQNVSVDGGTPTTTGAGSFTALPATTAVEVEAIGGGGGSAGCPGTSSSQRSAAGGGGGGAWGLRRMSSGFTGVTVTVGIGGAGGAAGANNGFTGATSSFGTALTCAGGGGALASAAFNATDMGFSNVGLGGASISGANITSGNGGTGGRGLSSGTGLLLGGDGGSNGTGGAGPNGPGVTIPAIAGTSPGSGASGGCLTTSSAAIAGAAGAAGLIIVREYA